MSAKRVLTGTVLFLALAVCVVAETSNPGEPSRPPQEPAAVDRHGDPLPAGAVARLGTIRFRNVNGVRGLAYSPDGKELVCNNQVVWDAATGKVLYRLPDHCQAVSPDWKMTAHFDPASKEQPKIILREMHSGKKLRELAWPTLGANSWQRPVTRFAPNGKSIVVLIDDEFGARQARAAVIDSESGKVLADFKAANFFAHAFSPDSETLALGTMLEGGSGTLQLWNIAKGLVVRNIDANKDYDRDIAFSPDGKMLAAGGSGHRVLVFDTSTGKEVGRTESNHQFGSGSAKCAFSPDGKTLVADLGAGTIHLWDVASTKTRLTLDGGMFVADSLAFSPKGKTLAVGLQAAVRFWNVETGKELLPELQGLDSAVASLAFSPDGKTLATGGGQWNQIRLWDFANFEPDRKLETRSGNFAFSPDGKQLISCANNNAVHVWELATGKEALRINVPEADRVWAFQFSPNGNRLFTMDIFYDRMNRQEHKHRLSHWDLATGKLQDSWTLGAGLQPVLLAPDGETVVVQSKKSGSILNLRTGRDRWLEDQEEGINDHWQQGELSGDGRVLAAGRREPDYSLWLWEISTGKKIDVLKGHDQPIGSLAWSPDCRVLATGDGFSAHSGARTDLPQSIRLWDLATRKQLKCITGLDAQIGSLAISPDGRFLIAGLSDTTILVWKMADLVPKLEIQDPSQAQLENYWADLQGQDAGKAHRAIWALIAAPKPALAMLRDRLKPMVAADADKVRKLIAELDDDKFTVREAATKELTELGWQAGVEIEKALKGKLSEEKKNRLESIANRMHEHSLPVILRTSRSLMVLEKIGSPEARQVLQKLADGAPGVPVTQEANAALKRLSSRQAKEP